MLQQNISQNQQQVLSVDQRQSLQILAYTNQELDAFLTEEYMQNPLLDCKRDRQSEIIDSLDSHFIKNEDHAHPLSDDKIAKILKGEGTSISRRTVAKYRQQLGIPDSRLRTYL